MPVYDETSPYDIRWPRPGPAMVLVAAFVGLIGGIVLGLAVSAFSGPPTKANASAPPTSAPVSTTLPSRFYAVIIASIPLDQPRSVVEARARSLAAQGYRQVGVLDPNQYQPLSQWAIYSGVFSTFDQAAGRRDQLVAQFPGRTRPYVKGPITRR
jgi:hypothetical protein